MTETSASFHAPFSAGLGRTTVAVPSHSCDCHVHVYDSQFPSAAGATLLPPDATVADYGQLQQRTLTQRVVFVTPSTYGFDNRPILEAMELFVGDARGVAVIHPSTSDDEIARLDRAGIRGVRLNLLHGSASSLDHLESLASRIAPFGWHVQLCATADLLAELGPRLERLPVHVVFDHFANISPSAWNQSPAYQLVLRLLQEGRGWVKISGAANISESTPPSYHDLAPLARSYLRAAPDRILWGTDWPHPTSSVGLKPLPDDAQLMDLLGSWVADEGLLRRVLVTNPASLYHF